MCVGEREKEMVRGILIEIPSLKTEPKTELEVCSRKDDRKEKSGSVLSRQSQHITPSLSLFAVCPTLRYF